MVFSAFFAPNEVYLNITDDYVKLFRPESAMFGTNVLFSEKHKWQPSPWSELFLLWAEKQTWHKRATERPEIICHFIQEREAIRRLGYSRHRVRICPGSLQEAQHSGKLDTMEKRHKNYTVRWSNMYRALRSHVTCLHLKKYTAQGWMEPQIEGDYS